MKLNIDTKITKYGNDTSIYKKKSVKIITVIEFKPIGENIVINQVKKISTF